jgi:hypothetical protein
VHDESAEHACHFLHGHVGVVEVCARLVNVEFVDKAAAWFHWLLADAGHAVVADHVFKAVPVDGAWLG